MINLEAKTGDWRWAGAMGYVHRPGVRKEDWPREWVYRVVDGKGWQNQDGKMRNGPFLGNDWELYEEPKPVAQEKVEKILRELLKITGSYRESGIVIEIQNGIVLRNTDGLFLASGTEKVAESITACCVPNPTPSGCCPTCGCKSLCGCMCHEAWDA